MLPSVLPSILVLCLALVAPGLSGCAPSEEKIKGFVFTGPARPPLNPASLKMKRIALKRPEYWRSLIADVRQVCDGSLVYAAKWDSYDAIEFWDRLDYIGVDAYFPLSESRTPTAEEIEAAWNEHLRRIDGLHARFEKPVIFTEWGYEDEDFAGKEPWVMGRPQGAGASANQQGQANAYEGTLRSVWNRSWMHGVFVWRWSPGTGAAGPLNYSPRGKSAESVLRGWFAHQAER